MRKYLCCLNQSEQQGGLRFFLRGIFMRFFLGSLILLLLFFGIASACGQNWTYIGNDYEADNCIIELEDSTGIFLRCGFSPGIYRWAGQDTTWLRIGTIQEQVIKLLQFPSYPFEIFAFSVWGNLYRSYDDGQTWDTVRISDTGTLYHFSDFTVCPYNFSNWYLSGHSWTEGHPLYSTSNEGESWDRHSVQARCYDFIWFDEAQGYLYFTEQQRGFLRLRLSDYSVEIVFDVGSNNVIGTAIRHPIHSWVYLATASLDEPKQVLRYDINTGDTIRYIVPEEFYCDLYRQYLYYSEDRGLFVNGLHNLYHLSDDLQTVEDYTGNLSEDGCKRIIYASRNTMIAEVRGQGLFCRFPIDPVAPDRPQRSSKSIVFYPNPAREFICFVPASQAISRVEIFNLLGQRVFCEPFSGSNPKQKIVFPSLLPNGIYFLHIEAGGQAQTRKMMLLR